MKRTLIIAATLLAIIGAVYASDRLRVIVVDGAARPAVSTASNPATTAPTAGSVTVTLGTKAASTQAAVTSGSKAASTQVALTLQTQTIYVGLTSGDALTNAVVVVTNATVNTAWAFATDTAVVLTNVTQSSAPYGFASDTAVVVTNATAAGSAYGFSQAQATSILTNSILFYNLLQSY